MVVIERGTCIGKALNQLIEGKVNITTHTKAVGVVVLGITKVQEIFTTVVVDVGIEVCALAATLYLSCSLRTVIYLADILVRIVVHVGITIRIQSRSVIIDILLRISRSKTVVCTSFIIQGHVLSRTEIFRKLFCHMKTGVSVHLHLQTVNSSTFGGYENSALGSLRTIEHHGLCTLEEGDLLNLGRKHIV